MSASMIGQSTGCSAESELPVVARGKYVELATEREDRICGGTLALLDGLVGAGFEFIGETPPDDVFIRYEWLPEPEEQVSLTGLGKTFRLREGILIQTDQLIDEHELGHAVPASVWPKSATFLREGLAVLLDGRRIYDQHRWSESKSIDDVIDGDFTGGRNYYESWFLVSQIVRDHGVEGLRALWFEVSSDATGADVRKTYGELFGRPMEALLAPVPYDPNTGMGGERVPCKFALCPGEALPVAGGPFVAPGPMACEDDPTAIGPHSRLASIDGPPVWRETVVLPEGRYADVEKSESLAVSGAACFLDCTEYGMGRTVWVPELEQWRLNMRSLGAWRLEVRQELEALPTDDPGGIVVFPVD